MAMWRLNIPPKIQDMGARASEACFKLRGTKSTGEDSMWAANTGLRVQQVGKDSS